MIALRHHSRQREQGRTDREVISTILLWGLVRFTAIVPAPTLFFLYKRVQIMEKEC